MICSLPLIMVIGFLGLMFIVELCYGGKITTIKEYAIGYKNFTTATLVAIVLASTYGGGGLIRNVQEVYHQGLFWTLCSFVFSPLSFWLLSIVVLRMEPFMGNFSLAETIGQVYGKIPRIITVLCSMLSCISFLAIQIIVTTQVISLCMGDIHTEIIPMISALILSFYAIFSRTRSVKMVDIVQFIAFFLIIPCLVWLMFININKPFVDIIADLNSFKKFQVNQVFQWDKISIGILIYQCTYLIGRMTYPSTIQRVYMSSNVAQGRKVLLISSIVDFFIKGFILLVGVLAFASNPYLEKAAIWPIITMKFAPLFKGFLAISLLAMSMSTADACLNTCSVMVVHDMINTLRSKKMEDSHQLRLARLIVFLVGLLALLLTVKQKDLVKLFMLGNSCFVPIVTAPLLLAIYGFRSSSRTALIGIVTGAMVSFVLGKYLSGIDSAFLAMLANGIAMLLAHYGFLGKTQDSWVKPSLAYQQLKQAKKRRYYRFKQNIKSFCANVSNMPVNACRVVFLASYILMASWLQLFGQNMLAIYQSLKHQYLLYWPLFQCLVALSMIIYVIVSRTEPIAYNRYVWLFVLIFCLPIDALWHMAYDQNQHMALALSFSHFGMFFLLLPTYMAFVIFGLVVFTVLCVDFGGQSFLAILLGDMESFLPAVLLLVGLIYVQRKYIKKAKQVQLFATQQHEIKEQEIQRATMVRYLDMVTTEKYCEGDILTSFFDNIDAEQNYRQTLDARDRVVNFAAFFDERARLAQGYFHLNLQTISLYDLINRLETSLETTLNYLPSIYIEPSLKLSTVLTCDVTLITQALEDIVISLLDSNYKRPIQQQIIAIAFFATKLKLSASNLPHPQISPLKGSCSAIAIRLYNATTYPYALPTIQSSYDRSIEQKPMLDANAKNSSVIQVGDLEKRTIKFIMAAHCGYYLDCFTLEQKNAKTLGTQQSHESPMPQLVVLPKNSGLLQKDSLAYMSMAKRSVKDVKIMGDAVIGMLEFQHFMVKVVKLNQSVLSKILYLLKKAYGIRTHDCGQLFLQRAIGITQEVATFVPDHNIMYATLLYDVPCYTWVPMSYIKAHYDFDIAKCVEELLSMSDLRQDQKYKPFIAQNKLNLVCVKLVERWYDLKYAKGYKDKKQVVELAKEALEVDLPVARQFFSNVIGKNLARQLESVALQTLKLV